MQLNLKEHYPMYQFAYTHHSNCLLLVKLTAGAI